jgi:hypothetical protein
MRGGELIVFRGKLQQITGTPDTRTPPRPRPESRRVSMEAREVPTRALGHHPLGQRPGDGAGGPRLDLLLVGSEERKPSNLAAQLNRIVAVEAF